MREARRQESQRVGQRQYPLPQRAFGQYLIVWCQPAEALDFNFRVAIWNTSHSPAGNVTMQIFPASGTSVYRASVVLHRGTIPTPRIVYDATSRIVTFHYGIADFPVGSNLLEQSLSTFVNFTDASGAAYAYLYTNHAP